MGRDFSTGIYSPTPCRAPGSGLCENLALLRPGVLSEERGSNSVSLRPQSPQAASDPHSAILNPKP